MAVPASLIFNERFFVTILRIQTTPLRPLFETDFRGEIVEPNRARTQPFEISCELQMSKRRLSFNVKASVPKTLTDDEKHAGRLAMAWLVNVLPNRFAEGGYWDFFDYTKVAVERAVEAEVREFYAHESDVTLSPGIEKEAQAACALLAQTEEKFESAKKRLGDLASKNFAPGFKQSLGEARDLTRAIEQVLGASATLGGYSSQDARTALRNYEELAQRQVESNHNYQSALTALQRFAFGVTFPQLWGRRPPV